MNIRRTRVFSLAAIAVVVLVGGVWAQSYAERWFVWQEMDRVSADYECCTQNTAQPVCDGWYQDLAREIDAGGDVGRRAGLAASACPGAQEWLRRDELSDEERLCGWTATPESREEIALRLAADGDLASAVNDECRLPGREAALHAIDVEFEAACPDDRCNPLLLSTVKEGWEKPSYVSAQNVLRQHPAQIVPALLGDGPYVSNQTLALLKAGGMQSGDPLESLLQGGGGGRRLLPPRMDDRGAAIHAAIIPWMVERAEEPGRSIARLWRMGSGEDLPTTPVLREALSLVPCNQVGALLEPIPVDEDQRAAIAPALAERCPDVPRREVSTFGRRGRSATTLARQLTVDMDDPGAVLCARFGHPAERRGAASTLAETGALVPLLARGKSACSIAGREAGGEVLRRRFDALCGDGGCDRALAGIRGTEAHARIMLEDPVRLNAWLQEETRHGVGWGKSEFFKTALPEPAKAPGTHAWKWARIFEDANKGPFPELALKVLRADRPPLNAEPIARSMLQSTGVRRHLGALVLTIWFGDPVLDVDGMRRLLGPLDCNQRKHFEDVEWSADLGTVIDETLAECAK